MSPSRTLAFDTLLAVEHGAYASDYLAAHSQELDARDAGLASEIVFGVLRFQAQLDHLIAHYSGRAISRLDTEVLIALRMAIYQLRYLDRIPAHAAVGESIDLIKRARKRSAAGFANAVLRKVNRDSVSWPDRGTELSLPAWMLERWERHYGVEPAARMAAASLKPPERYVRVPAGDTTGLEATEIPGCYRVRTGTVEGFRQQDIGSQAVVPLLGLEPGMSFLDICAAPGNKTAQALESGVRAVACDLHLHRLQMLTGLGIPLVLLNGAQSLPFSKRFDRILVDAPCSGTGTLSRNPEIKWRLRPEDLADLHKRQAALLGHARQALAAGGRLVYSTCSLEPEENEQVVETVPAELVERTMLRLPGREAGDGFFAAVIKSG